VPAAANAAASAKPKPRKLISPKFPSTKPKKRKIRNIDLDRIDKGYDSDGELPFHHDYDDEYLDEEQFDEDFWKEKGGQGEEVEEEEKDGEEGSEGEGGGTYPHPNRENEAGGASSSAKKARVVHLWKEVSP
jgi:hypothetical protein